MIETDMDRIWIQIQIWCHRVNIRGNLHRCNSGRCLDCHPDSLYSISKKPVGLKFKMDSLIYGEVALDLEGTISNVYLEVWDQEGYIQ